MYRYYVSQAMLKGGATELPTTALAQVCALLHQPEMVVGTWRAARTSAPDVTEQEVLLALVGVEWELQSRQRQQ